MPEFYTSLSKRLCFIIYYSRLRSVTFIRFSLRDIFVKLANFDYFDVNNIMMGRSIPYVELQNACIISNGEDELVRPAVDV